MRIAEQALREFTSFLAREAPGVSCAADIGRHHIEAYKSWLAHAPSRWRHPAPAHHPRAPHNAALLLRPDRRMGLSRRAVASADLRRDLPIPDQPLPRFLDDAASAKLLRAARADPDPFARLVIELLARTGLRRGELMALAIDAVVQIGSAYWLRVPIGKLHNDRYIPLHPQLKTLLDDWLADRPAGLRST